MVSGSADGLQQLFGIPDKFRDPAIKFAALLNSHRLERGVRLEGHPLGVDEDAIMAAKDMARLSLMAQAVETLIGPDEWRREFLRLTGAVTKAHKTLLPDEWEAPYLKPVAVFHTLSDAVKAKLGPVDISAIAAKIAALLGEKIEGVAILTPIVEGDTAEGRLDLSGVDFEKLAGLFATNPKIAAETLREATEKKVRDMTDANPTEGSGGKAGDARRPVQRWLNRC